MLYLFFCLDLDYCSRRKNWHKSFQTHKAIGLWWYWQVRAIVVVSYLKAEGSSIPMPSFFFLVLFINIGLFILFLTVRVSMVDTVLMLLVAVFIWWNWRTLVDYMLWRPWTKLWCWTATRSDNLMRTLILDLCLTCILCTVIMFLSLDNIHIHSTAQIKYVTEGSNVIVNQMQVHRACIEREIISMLDHPFLPTLYSSFQVFSSLSL